MARCTQFFSAYSRGGRGLSGQFGATFGIKFRLSTSWPRFFILSLAISQLLYNMNYSCYCTLELELQMTGNCHVWRPNLGSLSAAMFLTAALAAPVHIFCSLKRFLSLSLSLSYFNYMCVYMNVVSVEVETSDPS